MKTTITAGFLLTALTTSAGAQAPLAFADFGIAQRLPKPDSAKLAPANHGILALEIPVGAGQVRTVTFPEAIKDINFPAALSGKLSFGVDPKAGEEVPFYDTLPFMATEPFPPHAILVTTASGRLHQLMVAARVGAPIDPVKIVEPARAAAPWKPRPADAQTPLEPTRAPAAQRPRLDVALIRYAAQRFETAPRVFADGVLEAPNGVNRVAVSQKPVRLIRNQLAEVIPIISVQSYQTVTAVWVRNISNMPFRLDVCKTPDEFDCVDLVGQWLSMTYIEPDRWLYPGERRRIYLSSRKPFLAALGEVRHVE